MQHPIGLSRSKTLSLQRAELCITTTMRPDLFFLSSPPISILKNPRPHTRDSFHTDLPPLCRYYPVKSGC